MQVLACFDTEVIVPFETEVSVLMYRILHCIALWILSFGQYVRVDDGIMWE